MGQAREIELAKQNSAVEAEAMDVEEMDVDGWASNVYNYMECQNIDFLNKNEFYPTAAFQNQNQFFLPEQYFEPMQAPVPTVAELRFMGANLNHICVNFAANGHCPRGDKCKWIHCRVDGA